ncbi:class I SAM-dependent methyltransferase [Psychroserpens sp. XS_ASV72]
MNQIYEQHLWGGSDFDFYSGEGSHNPSIVEPYLKAVISFLKSHNNNLTVCDLGCGDFNVGKQLLKYTKSYTGIDIVEALIKRNKTKFNNKNLEFQCLDISKDQLPVADCIILRQVLQHLSNEEIQSIVENIKTYKYIILTEHIPRDSFEPNKDIISSQGNRLKYNSGVDLLRSPFDLESHDNTLMCKTILEDNKSQIVTTLLTL